jgi:oxygen-dependent protoporphyrinogen oxidase
VTVIEGEVEAVERAECGFRVRIAGNWTCFRKLAFACEAHSSARLALAIDPVLAEQLSLVPYHSSNVIALGFDAASFRRQLEGFGFLVPRRERRLLTACTFMGTKFPFRAPKGKTLLRCFVGGSSPLDDESLLRSVLEELREVIGLAGSPLFSRVYRWPRSMAQYTTGHRERIQAIEARLRQCGGVYLAGNAFDGIGIPDCIRSGRQLAQSIVN